MRSKIFRIGLGAGLAVFMGAVAVFGCALPRFVRAESVNENVGSVSSPQQYESANASEAANEIVPRTDDEVVYTTTQGLVVKKQNATLYMTINGVQYEIVGQGNGADKLETVSGYTDLEYLSLTGGPYTNVNLKTTSNTKIESKIYVPSSGQASEYGVLFSSCTSSSWAMAWYAYSASGSVGGLGKVTYCWGPNFTYVANGFFDQDYVITCKSTLATYTNGSVTYTQERTGSYSSTTTLAVFTDWNSNRNGPGGSTYFTGRCYYMKIWESNSLVRDLLPLKRNSDNVSGLYDLVNGVFYTSHTTAFTAGPNKVPDWASASVYADSSPAAAAISADAKSGNKSLAGIANVSGCDVGYLVVKNGANYLKVRI